MGATGRMPKRSDQLRRPSKETREAITKLEPLVGRVEPPELPGDDGKGMMHPIPRRLYESLKVSGQSRFYEPSDWEWAVAACCVMSQALSKASLSAQQIENVIKMWQPLLITEGERRRMRLELQRETAVDPDEEAAVSTMAEYRDMLG